MKRVSQFFSWIAMAWNSPERGNRNSGPPDLDELWRRFNARLAGLFGGERLIRRYDWLYGWRPPEGGEAS